MVNIAGIEVDPNIIYGVAGAIGALVRTLNWKIENPTLPLSPYLTLRNIIIGGVAGVVADSSWVSAMTAGLTTEFILQNVGQKVAEVPPVANVLSQVGLVKK